jgi:hypothetical protein
VGSIVTAVTRDRVPAASSAAATSGHTVVWIEAENAVIVSWRDGNATIERLASDVPARRRSVGHIRHDPLVRHGGGEAQAAGEPHRRELLARFVETVRARLPEADELSILGHGPVREHLERRIREEDRVHGRDRPVSGEASPPLTDRQLVARVRRLAGHEAPRRRVGTGL